MDENNNIKLITREEQTQTMDKRIVYKPSLFNKTYSQNNINQSPQNDIKNKTNDNFDNSQSLLNLLSNKSHFVEPKDFKIIPEIKTYNSVKNKLLPIKQKTKKVNFDINPFKKQFYLTASINPPIIKKKEIKKSNSTKNLYDNNRNNIIDLIHEKEIQICQDLIRTLPEKVKNRNKKNKKNYNNVETDNLIKLIKTFNIDNINTQRIIEHQILNRNNYNSEFNPLLSTLSVSMSTNYKTNNIPLNNFYKFNLSNYSINKNLNSSITLKNNSSILKNINDSNILLNNNNNSLENVNLEKSKLMKSINNRNNNNKFIHSSYNKMIYDPKNEINFHTGFVRSQKNIYDDVYSKYFKNNKKNEIRIKNYRRKKEEANKLSLPEIEEYKSIIKEIENRKSKALRKSQSALDIHKDKNDLVLKDQLIEELNNIYIGQKNTFLNSIKDNNFGDNEKMEDQTCKQEINENIKNINKIKREPNSFVDGYSLFDGGINKKLEEYNYILGNKFHDKEQKEIKAEKFHKIYEEYENKIKNYKNELLNEKYLYKQIFIPKIDFNKDKNKDDSNEENMNKKNFNFYKLNGNFIIASNKVHKFQTPMNVSGNNNKKNQIYNEYIAFKNEYKKKYE